MSPTELLLLFIAGIAAGITGSTAGLASLVSYPALLLVGLPPVTANVTNTIGLIGSSVGAVLGSRSELRTVPRAAFAVRVPLALVGGAIGATVLLVSPPGSFARIVPFLVALASVLLLLTPQIRRVALRRQREALAKAGNGSPAAAGDGGFGVTAVVFVCCVYAGYFGAAAGVMILAILLIGTGRNLPVSNAVKNLLLGVANGTAAVIFAFVADPYWPAVPPLLIGCLIGGYLGPAVVRRVPPDLWRWVVGLAGLGLAVRLWLG